MAVHNKALMCAEYLLDIGADINAVDVYGETPVIRAAFLGDLDMIKLLVSYGADLNKVSYYGGSTLHHAYASPDFKQEIVDFLIERGVDVNLLDKHGKNAVQWKNYGEAINNGAKLIEANLNKSNNVKFEPTLILKEVFDAQPTAVSLSGTTVPVISRKPKLN
jgi:ankyrin repeat protein